MQEHNSLGSLPSTLDRRASDLLPAILNFEPTWSLN